MKIYYSLLAYLLYLPVSYGQQVADTLFANERQVLSIFFDSHIEKAITGAEHFTFTFNREQGENLGLLQATPGPDSNLLVITEGGAIHTYVLSYRDSLSQFVRHEKASQPVQSTPKGSSPKETNKQTVANICKQMLLEHLPYATSKNEKGIKIRITSSFYHEQLVYICYEIDNATRIDYEVDSFSLLRVLGNKSVRSSYQESELPAVYSYKMPGRIPQHTASRFIKVYPKFTLGGHESLKVNLREKNGSRNVDYNFQGL